MKKFVLITMAAAAFASVATLSGCATGATAPRAAAAPVDDAAIKQRVTAALAADPELAAVKVTVDSTGGVVRLRGEIKNITLWRKAADIAGKAQGVKSVENHMIITG